MAEPGTTRRRVLGAAAALPALALPCLVRAQPVEAPPVGDDRVLWNERLTRYRLLASRAQAAAETGWFRAANDRFYREAADPTQDQERAFARLDRAEDLYWHRCVEPLHDAAIALALAPVPNLEALQTKIAVVRAHQLHEPQCMERDCLEVLEEDVGRLRLLP